MNHLILWKDMRLFVGKTQRPTITHSHPVIQFVVAKQGNFKTKNNLTRQWETVKGLLIRPNYAHECDATDTPILSLDIDSNTNLGEWIQSRILKKHDKIVYPSENLIELDFASLEYSVTAGSWNSLRKQLEDIFNFDNWYDSESKDLRIKKVINYIHQNIHALLTNKELTAISFLSESRLLHLFKEEMGLPIRNYILWYRLKIAVEEIMAGSSLTEAAYLAGFSDQSHFTRTYQKMIGLPPSMSIKNSKFVQVSFS